MAKAGILNSSLAPIRSGGCSGPSYAADPESRDEAFEPLAPSSRGASLCRPAKGSNSRIKGAPAGILQSCEDGGKAKPGTVSSAGRAELLKIVAGACNCLELLLIARLGVAYDSYLLIGVRLISPKRKLGRASKRFLEILLRPASNHGRCGITLRQSASRPRGLNDGKFFSCSAPNGSFRNSLG